MNNFEKKWVAIKIEGSLYIYLTNIQTKVELTRDCMCMYAIMRGIFNFNPSMDM